MVFHKGIMGQWDNPRSASLLFFGAFLISIGLIALLNVEVQSRKLKTEPGIKNENLFQVIGRRFCQMATSWKEKHQHSGLFKYFSNKETLSDTRPSSRTLKSIQEDLTMTFSEEKVNNSTKHPIRHEKHRKVSGHKIKSSKLKAIELKQFVNRTIVSNSENTTVNGKTPEEQTKWNMTNTHGTLNLSEGVAKSKIEVHLSCYTTNEVLEIIAATCFVNFIFWFLIISCVNFYTKNQKIWKSESCESLESIVIDRECDGKYKDRPPLNVTEDNNKYTSSSYMSVQEYINSLPTESFNENTSMISLHELNKDDKHTERRREDDCLTSKASNKQRKKDINEFYNMFNDVISVDNLKPLTANRMTNRETLTSKETLSSFSMEDLLF